MNQNLIQEKIVIREVGRNGQPIIGILPPIEMKGVICLSQIDKKFIYAERTSVLDLYLYGAR